MSRSRVLWQQPHFRDKVKKYFTEITKNNHRAWSLGRGTPAAENKPLENTTHAWTGWHLTYKPRTSVDD